MIQIQNVPHFSIIELDGEAWVKGCTSNRLKFCLLMNTITGKSKRITPETDVEVIRYPSELASEWYNEEYGSMELYKRLNNP